MSPDRKKIVLFLGAGAVQHLKYKITSEFFEMLDQKATFKNNTLWKEFTHPNIVDIEQVLYILEKIIGIGDRMLGVEEEGSYNFRDWKKEISPVQKPLQLDFYSNFVKKFYGMEISQKYNTKDELIEEARTLKTEIEFEINKEYGRKVKSSEIHNMGSFIELLAEHATNLSVFTTNYENEVRKKIGEKNIIDDGFDDGEFNPYYKEKQSRDQKAIIYGQLHGSVTWVKVRNYIKNDQNLTRSDSEHEKPVMIYPTLDLKDERYESDPYNYHLGQFKRKIGKADICIIIGFSFRDKLSRIFSECNGNIFIIDKISKTDTDKYDTYLKRLKSGIVNIDIKLINEKNVFLDGFPLDDESLEKLLSKIDHYCGTNLTSSKY